MNTVLILIPAAGAARRMGGRDKLLEQIDGSPLLTRQVRRALATGARVHVVLSRDHPQRQAALGAISDPRLTCEPVDGREGMAVALRHAARLALGLDGAAQPLGLMILPADMPELDSDDLNAVIAAFSARPGRIHRGAVADGRPGHPVIFPRRLFARLEGLTGDSGARGLLAGEELCLTPLPGAHALTDLDTPEDWDAWRRNRS